ncbi:MAG: hypothetical protein ABSH09_27220 [Bryobacteraceae bacterium]|jgi:hypothetical protein
MDVETRQFLEQVAASLEKNLSAEINASELRLQTNLTEQIVDSKRDILTEFNRWSRTRDLRLSALESRLGELETRVRQVEDKLPPAA